MNPWPDTSKNLIERLVDLRDESAWNRMVDLYRPVILRMVRQSGFSAEQAEDLCQTILLRIVKSISGWKERLERPRFRSWLGRIARNAVIGELSRKYPDSATGSSSIAERLLSIPDPISLGERFQAEAKLEAYRLAARVVQRDFSEKTWAIFEALTVEGRSVSEVAKQFECTEAIVYGSKFRVAVRLRETIAELSEYLEDSD